MATRTVLLIIAAVLVVVGLGLTLVTDPAGEEGGAASRGISDVSEDTRPYLW